jgi:Tfp pilus tip-associated adhesin PilY1
VAVDIYAASTSSLTEDVNYWFIDAASGDADKMVYPFASAGSMLNLNSKEDNLYDVLYIPDLAGQMWKVNVTDPNVSNWEAKCIFQPPIPDTIAGDSLCQPAFFAPLIEREPAIGCYWIFYGTGDRAHIFKENVNNRFYAILDTVTDESGPYPLTEDDDLKNIWLDDLFNLSTDFPDNNGWFISYADSASHIDEKTVSQAILLADTLIFSTFVPTESSGICNIGTGGAREYYCQYKTGGGHIRNLGSGIPQAPRYSFSMDGEVLIVHQTSDSILVETGTGYGTLKRVLKWKER